MAFGFFSALRARLLSNSSLAQESAFDGQTFFQSFFEKTNVQNTPAFLIDNDFVRLFNFGQINTENADAAISVTGENASIVNFRSGRIDADSGPDAQATAVDVTGSANIRNFGSIDGEFNGVSFTGAQSSGRLDNFRGATISSDSRAVNIDGEGVQVRNFGDILGTGDQRNGTIYANASAEDISIRNFSRATVDAGEGNQGAGISLEIGDEQGDVVEGTITNGFGATIQGRGQAASNTPLAGDGIRINNGAEGTVFQGNIVNQGRIASESDQGTTGGIRVADGVGFDGSIVNGRTGVIEGVRNGLYVGNGEHDLDIRNAGNISSGSRAVNIDGTGVDLSNTGRILGTGDQRNGTVYADSTADEYTIYNGRSGVIDAGAGNNGSGVALQTGDVVGDVVSASVTNDGVIQGRGDAESANGIGNGLRIFAGSDVAGTTSFAGDIVNNGLIAGSEDSPLAAGIRVESGVDVLGAIINDGEIRGAENSIDGREGGSLNIINDGLLNGNVLLGDESDILISSDGEIRGTVDAGGGDDVVLLGDENTVVTGGLGDDTLDGGEGNDTAAFDDLNVGIVADLEAGVVTRNGFAADVAQQGLVNPNQGITNELAPADIVSEAVAGNIYFNVHTTEFPTGEVRGQLELVSDAPDGNGGRVVTLTAALDGAQEVPVPADTPATGTATVVFTINAAGEVSYETDLDVSNLQGELLPVNIGNGTLSPIHLHNAPAGQNGPVVADVATDAGEGLVIIDETDTLENIENVIGSGGDDQITGDEGDNVLTGGLGDDTLDGGEGNDTAAFDDLNVGIVADLQAGTVSRSGFAADVAPQALVNPNQGITNELAPADIVSEAVAGNIYFNVHTTEFPSGEVRGQLELVSDVADGNGGRVVTLTAALDGAQEVPAPADTPATGTATVVFTINAAGEVSYETDLDVSNLQGELLPVNIGNGTLSPIHLHNAPAGQNGPVVADVASDAGEGLVVIDETDTVDNIENVIGSGGDDQITGDEGDNGLSGGAGDDLLTGGLGDDALDGGEGIDTASYDDLNVGIVADLEAGIVTRNGFAADVAPQVLVNPNQGVTNELAPADIVSEAVAGNIYFNVHTTEFPSGEVRGQLELVSDAPDGNGGRIVTLTAALDGAQEVPVPADTPATGTATVVFTINAAGEISYETDLDVSNLQGELLPVNIGNGTLSPIHLHNAPAGQNGPVVADVATDAGEGLVIIDETDTLENIENVIGSGGDDQITGDDGDNSLTGGAGDDLLTGADGEDVFVFSEGSGDDIVTDFGNGGQDRLDVSAFGADFDLESVIDGAVQDGEDTVITLSDSESVRLAGFDVEQLDEDDFIVFGENGDDDADPGLGNGDGDALLDVSGLGPDFDPESTFNGAVQDGDITSVTLTDNDTVRVAGFDGDQQNQDDFIA